jgi:large subunit ribosomal protein L29
MKSKELREWNDEELQSELDRLRRHLFDVRAQAVTEKLEDPSLLTKARRDVARILTEQNRRKHEKQAAQAAK